MFTTASSGKWRILMHISWLWTAFGNILQQVSLALKVAKTCILALAIFLRMIWIGSKFPTFGNPLPLLGHLYEILSKDKYEMITFCISGAKKCPLGVMKIGPIPVFYVTDPRDLEKIMKSSSCNQKSLYYNIIKYALGPGLITISGEEWQRHHRIIHPSFSTKVLDSAYSCFNKYTDFFIAEICKFVDEDKEINVLALSEVLFALITFETLMGSKGSSFHDPKCEMIKCITEGERSIFERFLRPWLYIDWIYRHSSIGKKIELDLREYRDFRTDIIKNRMQELKRDDLEDRVAHSFSGKKSCLSFLDQLLIAEKISKSITMEEIQGEVDNVTAAAIDSTSITFSYTLYELSRYLNVQDRILEELETIYNPSLPKINVTAEDVSRMTYIDMVVKEVLRLHSIIPLAARYVTEDVQLVTRDLVLPAGAQVVIGFIMAHMNPEFYPNPEEFNPENFLPEREKMRHPYAFLPFSAGARSCIGKRLAMMELKAILAKVIWELEFLPVSTYVPKEEWGITLKPDNGVILRARKRRK